MSRGAMIAGAVGVMICCSASSAVMMMGGSEEPKVEPEMEPEVKPKVEPKVEPKHRYVRITRDKEGTDHWMNLAEVEVFSGGTNVAQGKTVTQSSISHPGTFDPPNLVDGNKTNFAHTNNEAVEWFQIDLGQDYEIEKVVIHNRSDCCQGRLRNTKVQLSKSADMSSPKESRLITTQEAPNAVITWNVKTNKIVPGGYEWGLMDPNVEHTGWTDGLSYEACAKLAKDRGHLAWGVQTGYHPQIVAAGKSIGGCWTRPNLTNFTKLVPGDINHVSGCADATKLVSSKCV